MAKIRSILRHVRVEVAERQRMCHRSRGKHNIPRGTSHLAVVEGSYGSRKNYCVECARPILDTARKHLSDLVAALDGSNGG